MPPRTSERTLLFLVGAVLLLASAVAYGVGSLPLGARLVRLISGQNPRATSAHNLGVENLVRFVGLPAALGSFCLDVTKGAAVLALFAGSPWAALGVYAGHLYPLPWWREGLPRGRGNGVLLGVLVGLGTGAMALSLVMRATVNLPKRANLSRFCCHQTSTALSP